MDAVVHRLEALPGDGRWAVTFRRGDGSEQTAVVQLSGAHPDTADVEVAEAGLPAGWTRTDSAWRAAADAIRALERSRRAGASGATVLRDPNGGWDVSLGNVVIGVTGRPACIAHGELTAADGRWTCAECGAAALYDQG